MPLPHRAFDDLTPDVVAGIERTLAMRPRGLFSDVDGTLSAIAPVPEAAALLPGVRPLLEEARGAFDTVAVVSGRAAADAQRLVDVAGITYIGNHGLELLFPDGTTHVYPAALPYRQAIADALGALEQTLAPHLSGLRIESKDVTATVHVRNTVEPLAAEKQVYQVAVKV